MSFDLDSLMQSRRGENFKLHQEFLNPQIARVLKTLDGLLACGRHISCDANSHGFLREIPQCWLTGQAAGVAAALAVAAGVQPRALDLGSLQRALRGQGVYLRVPAAAPQAVS